MSQRSRHGFEIGPAAPKGGSSEWTLTVCVNAYPDTNRLPAPSKLSRTFRQRSALRNSLLRTEARIEQRLTLDRNPHWAPAYSGRRARIASRLTLDGEPALRAGLLWTEACIGCRLTLDGSPHWAPSYSGWEPALGAIPGIGFVLQVRIRVRLTAVPIWAATSTRL
jgi:hypothetical protein